MTLAKDIRDRKVGRGEVAIWWVGQAGFAFKSAGGTVIYVDPFLTECLERITGGQFKRLTPSPIAPEDVRADFVVVTHRHEDHLDPDAIPVIANRSKAKIVGPDVCVAKCREWGIPDARLMEVNRGQKVDLKDVTMLAVPADHGDMAPEAIGIVLDFAGLRVYMSGDTAYQPAKLTAALELRPEVVIPVINGAFGNLNEREAAMLARDAGAKVVIPSHFWSCAEHRGDPWLFMEACKEIVPGAKVMMMQQGGCYVHRTAEQGSR